MNKRPATILLGGITAATLLAGPAEAVAPSTAHCVGWYLSEANDPATPGVGGAWIALNAKEPFYGSVSPETIGDGPHSATWMGAFGKNDCVFFMYHNENFWTIQRYGVGPTSPNELYAFGVTNNHAMNVTLTVPVVGGGQYDWWTAIGRSSNVIAPGETVTVSGIRVLTPCCAPQVQLLW